MSKSNEYGYIPESPTQASGSNTGIFEVNDVLDLIISEQWAVQDNLQLIETQSFSGVVNVDFTSIKETEYDTHFYVVNNVVMTTSTESVGLRFSESGVLETASVYEVAYQNRATDSTYSETKFTATTRIFATTAVGTGSADVIGGYGYIYNAGNSSKYTSVNIASTGIDSILECRYGGGGLPQASVVDIFRFFNNAGNNMSGKISLYGVLN